MGQMGQGAACCTELRVHGVSGTPPEAMLGHARVHLVAGDEVAGFYQPVGEHEPSSVNGEGQRLEAYSWGGLTSGSWQRALWLLLLPFMLVNVAFYMPPGSLLNEKPFRRNARKVSEAVQRVLALSLTATLVLATVEVAMDFIGWQCARGGTACATGGWLAFFQWPWLAGPGRRLAVTALVPLAVIALLWRLAYSTWARGEQAEMPSSPPHPDQWQSPLEDRSMWNGAAPVARLRALHVTAALSLVGIFLLAPSLSGGPDRLLTVPAWTDPGALPVTAFAAAFIVLVLVCLGGVALPSTGTRQRPNNPEQRLRWQPWVAWATAALVATSLTLTWFGVAGFGTLAAMRPPSMLPWLSGAIVANFHLQFLLVAVLFIACCAQAASARQVEPDAEAFAEVEGTLVEAPTAWFGLGSAVLAGLASLLAGGLAAALTLRVADILGTPAVEVSGVPSESASILLPLPHFWAAAAAAVLLAAGCVLFGAHFAWQARRKRQRVYRDLAEQAYQLSGTLEDWQTERARSIARTWARAAVSDVARRALGSFAIIAAGVAGVVLAAVLQHRRVPEWLVTVGGLVMGGAFVAFLFVARRSFSNPQFRRYVGVVWDLGTFWPRATHPLAPPCYAERAVPDLIRRIEYLGCEGGKVVLSCHSQGTVLGAAVVAQLQSQSSAATALLTYGSPLRRLYARFFPAYFDLASLVRIGELLRGAAPDQPEAQESQAPPRPAPREWPWVNLYRPTDPIGGPVFFEYPAFRVGQGDAHPENVVDWQLVDPQFDQPPGDSCYPPSLGHSNYFADSAFAMAVTLAQERRQSAQAGA